MKAACFVDDEFSLTVKLKKTSENDPDLLTVHLPAPDMGAVTDMLEHSNNLLSQETAAHLNSTTEDPRRVSTVTFFDDDMVLKPASYSCPQGKISTLYSSSEDSMDEDQPTQAKESVNTGTDEQKVIDDEDL